MRMLQGWLLSVAAVALAASAGAATITFDETEVGLVHGSLVSTQYEGVTISAVDSKGKPKPAVAFDSDLSNTLDPDLEFGKNGWSGGNLSDPPVRLGNLLIINENEKLCWTGVCSKPDDEAKGGAIIFEFDIPVLSFGFDLIDVEGKSKDKGKDHSWGWAWGWHWLNNGWEPGHDWDPGKSYHPGKDVKPGNGGSWDWGWGHDKDKGKGGSELGGSIIFIDSSTGTSVEIGMMTFLAGFELGNNTANRVPPFTAADLHLDSFDQVMIVLDGSGAIDNIVFEPVPEPTTVGLLGLGLAVLAARSRARRR